MREREIALRRTESAETALRAQVPEPAIGSLGLCSLVATLPLVIVLVALGRILMRARPPGGASQGF